MCDSNALANQPCACMALTACLGADGLDESYAQVAFRLAKNCRANKLAFRCTYGSTQVALSVLTMTWAFVYFALYFFYLMQSIYTLRKLPRQEHKMSHLMVRLQARISPHTFYTSCIWILCFQIYSVQPTRYHAAVHCIYCWS